jgi:phospholipase/carboxylesterase
MIDAYIHRMEAGAPGCPLAFLFHGTGGDEMQFLRLGRDLMPGATLISPRGDVSENGALRFFRRTGEGVYDMDDLARATSKMAGFVKAHVTAAAPDRVIGLGYSNGANILAAVMLDNPALFDDAVLMHPLIPWDPKPVPVITRTLITAGERDPICPPDRTRALEAWLKARGAPVRTLWHPGGHEIARSEIEAVATFLQTREATDAD